MSLKTNEAVLTRMEVLKAPSGSENEFTTFTDAAIVDVMQRILDAAPATVDVGRFIAALDDARALQHLLGNAALGGRVIDERKKRKQAESGASLHPVRFH